ncbi:MAG: hypothetical protein DDT19_02682 [Syntrophomonadaceae bacterium]|nr:hypothetical protein [Bacillota bacterium]
MRDDLKTLIDIENKEGEQGETRKVNKEKPVMSS